MYDSAVMTLALLLLFATLLGSGAAMVYFVTRATQRNAQCPLQIDARFRTARRAKYVRRPSCWLAVRSRDVTAVQLALDIHNPQPCSWTEGLAGEAKLFIAPPLGGWILVMGAGLPHPAEDVDACFRFVVESSRRLGEAQFFAADPMLDHHAWVKAQCGRVVRAYAWAGQTLWNEGEPTPAERQLALKCFGYADDDGEPGYDRSAAMAANVDRVPALAARWSLDPGAIDDRFFEANRGVAGEPARRY
jgi:hypothetical protein